MRAAFPVQTALVAVLLAAAFAGAGCDDAETPTTPTRPNTTTVNWSSSLALGGSTTRSFATTRTGTVSVTLQSVGASTTLRVGLGVGIPLADGSGCVLSRSVETTAGATAQLELTVDAGSYCLQVYDPGTLTSPVAFSITLVYPS